MSSSVVTQHKPKNSQTKDRNGFAEHLRLVPVAKSPGALAELSFARREDYCPLLGRPSARPGRGKPRPYNTVLVAGRGRPVPPPRFELVAAYCLLLSAFYFLPYFCPSLPGAGSGM